MVVGVQLQVWQKCQGTALNWALSPRCAGTPPSPPPPPNFFRRGCTGTMAFWSGAGVLCAAIGAATAWRHHGAVRGLLDRLYALNKVLGPYRPRFFSRGWGDVGAADGPLSDLLDRLVSGAAPLSVGDTLEWEDPVVGPAVQRCWGAFDSPLKGVLPPEAQRCSFRFVTPREGAACAWDADGRAPAAVVILLPATGEQGSGMRLALAAALAEERGWSSIVVTAPFYGGRRPAGQRAHFVDTVERFLHQSLAIMQVGGSPSALPVWRRQFCALLCEGDQS